MYSVEGVDPAVRDSSFMSVPAEVIKPYERTEKWGTNLRRAPESSHGGNI